jgi:Protein of unknown function (DUF3152)
MTRQYAPPRHRPVAGRPGPPRPVGRARSRPPRRGWLAVLATALVLGGWGALLPRLAEGARGAWDPSAPGGPAASPSEAPAPGERGRRWSPADPVARRNEPVLTQPGAVPARGSGDFAYAAETGPVLGRSGPVRRFRVGVERGSGEDVDSFAAAVEDTLGHPRSWAGGGGLRLQRVSGSSDHEFTVYLATRETAAQVCLAGGVDIRVGGRPYTSCRITGRVILNLDRWRRSATPYLEAREPLSTYRRYLVNHEVGHQLGRRHQACPGPGRPAPVMVQQTLKLDGCVP